MRPGLNELSIADPAWLEFVTQQPAANTFHHPAWARFVSDCYGYRAVAFTLADSTGVIRAGLPMLRLRRPLLGESGVSLPFTDHCPPLAIDGPALEELARALGQWRARARLELAVRDAMPEVGGWVQREVTAVRHTLALSTDANAVFHLFKKTQVRQPIAKAEREGITVHRSESLADVHHFYDLHLATRRRLGAPVQPRRFFELLWERLLASGLGFVLLASHAGRYVAGAVFLTWNGTLLYKYSASDSGYWQYRPNNLVLWTAIRWACENGLRSVDFGRTDLANSGLRAFKRGWGTQETPLIYSQTGQPRTSVLRGGSSRVHGLVNAIIRSSPPWVCRTIGEVFYRYAA